MERSRFPEASPPEAASRRLPPLAALLLTALLVGCGGSGEGDALLQDYQRELASALDLPAPEPASPGNIGAFPARDERLFEVSETRDGLLNVYALRECHITSLVAERNNQLGRVAPPSQRWLYELELWRRLHACQHSEIPETLSESHRERLTRLTETKTEQLPRVSWNSLFDSEEWTGSFSRASSPLQPDDAAAVETQLSAIAWLREATLNQFNPQWQHDSSTLENHLKTLRSRPLTAEVLRALMLAEQRLGEANALLEARLSRADTCRGLDAPGTELRARFETQPTTDWLTRLETLAERWLGAVEELLDSHIEPPTAVAEYRRHWLSLADPEAPLPAYRAALETHRHHWRTLAERCP
ncbi:DUF3080 family protein [Halomonas campisalis]|uniref:DUF3080 family protein n=1 Tax=Billgrantia campisalis TaxID=74661 RepID=A0ABS9PCK7_9GAMM|nr:DUF3080 family protein [Halomonas campisalis]MCG6659189.1 DUF3080 family protein [Halomonas campisalis]MDR5864975.1 DUF3080 family protein [Halomonas campisalis]